ncbi:MAG: hypothetical protein KIH62_001945 [Candidatus Kerfeldbacteria bacterium]|nr:hypothetical protein [Candidatus Kerfeldbacteria bacterium]
MNVERRRTIEHSPKPVDLPAARRARLEELRGQAWSTDESLAQPHWKKFVYDNDGRAVHYDPAYIITHSAYDFHPHPTDPMFNARVLAEHNRGWQYVGTVTNDPVVANRGHRFISVYLDTLQWETIPGVTLKFDLDFKTSFTLTMGSLVMHVLPQGLSLPLNYPWRASDQDWGRVAHMSMLRFKNGKPHFSPSMDISVRDHPREPELTEKGFLREFMAGFRQLHAMGFKHIISMPTDPRRLRIYTGLGMQKVQKGCQVYTDVDLEQWPRLQRYGV